MKKLILMVVAFIALVALKEVNAQAPTKSIAAAQYYEGGQEAMYKFINDNKIYPIMAKKNRMQGETIVHIQIEPDGRIGFATLVQNVNGGCGAEAVRVVKLLKFRAPGFKVDCNIPVYFKL
jgi:protein TonB